MFLLLSRESVRRHARFAPVALALLIIVPVGVVTAQRGGTYGGSGRVWWDGGTDGILPWEEEYENANGLVGILNTNGAVRTKDHAFFEPLGKNGRACVTCHQPSNAMSVSVTALRERWSETRGKDPIFAAVDGSNCPDLPQQLESSHSLLLNRGLFRIPVAWPPPASKGEAIKPEFRIEVVRDPTGCNTSPGYGVNSAHSAVSVYRGPRITANLKYVVASPAGLVFMADGREPSLRAQAISAALGHEEAEASPSERQLLQIVDFESQLYAAQSADRRGGLLHESDGPPPWGRRTCGAGDPVRWTVVRPARSLHCDPSTCGGTRSTQRMRTLSLNSEPQSHAEVRSSLRRNSGIRERRQCGPAPVATHPERLAGWTSALPVVLPIPYQAKLPPMSCPCSASPVTRPPRRILSEDA